MLTTSNSYTRFFLKEKRLVLDSSAVIRLVDDKAAQKIFTKTIERAYTVILLTPSVLEVGFSSKRSYQDPQVIAATKIYQNKSITPLELSRLKAQKRKYQGQMVLNPGDNEWLAARTLLVQLMKKTGKKEKNATALAFDALIYMCTWNTNSAIVTENVKDFLKFNAAQNPKKVKAGPIRHLPIYTVDNVLDSINKKISYPENIDKKFRASYGI